MTDSASPTVTTHESLMHSHPAFPCNTCAISIRNADSFEFSGPANREFVCTTDPDQGRPRVQSTRKTSAGQSVPVPPPRPPGGDCAGVASSICRSTLIQCPLFALLVAPDQEKSDSGDTVLDVVSGVEAAGVLCDQAGAQGGRVDHLPA